MAATYDIIEITSLNDLKAIRDGINSGEAFLYGYRKLPRYAEGVVFKLTVDLDLQSEKPWEPIGSVFSGSRFAGTFLGQGHTISNLSLDNDSVYFYRKSNVGGFFGMLSGEVRDLNFTNVHADSTVIVAGAVCAIAGIAGASLTTRIQDNKTLCRDTIRHCVNFADIVTHVGRGTNAAAHSVGGIIGHLTSALRCFNTGRISIDEAPQYGNYYIGGVVGINEFPPSVQYCYNAGSVNGSDRNHTGGIVGRGDPEYCYVSNTVTSSGTHLGSIAGSSPSHPNHCYYDKQLSTLNPLLSTLSVMPLVLGTGQTWAAAHDNFTLGGCDEHHSWQKIRGSVTVSDGCTLNVGAHDIGVIEFAAAIDDTPYRHITLKYNLDEDHALIIKNAIQFDAMRIVVNNADGGFYRFSDSTYHLTIPANANPDDFIAIQDGGNERFFKLISDIDINDTNGNFPFGGSSAFLCSENRGGTLYNCVIDSSSVTIGNYEKEQVVYYWDTLSLPCAINNGGLIDSCRVLNSQIVNDKIPKKTPVSSSASRHSTRTSAASAASTATTTSTTNSSPTHPLS